MKNRKPENPEFEQVCDILRRILENQLFMLDCGHHVVFRFQRYDVDGNGDGNNERRDCKR